MTRFSNSSGWKLWGLIIFALLNVAFPRSIIDALPGFSGDLPSKLETGYITVGDFDEVELFYYFFESEGNPKKDPLLLWLTGGPGCSGVSAFIDKKGPLIFDDESLSTRSLPTLHSNPYTYSKIANIIFIDSPVATGFSYATTNEGYYSNDTKATKDACTFLRKWLLDHPEYDEHPLYIGGDSYAGIFVAMLTAYVSEAIEAGLMPSTNLQGYVLGNPLIDAITYTGSRIPYAHRVALISDEYFESAKSSCRGDYVTRDPSNIKCLLDLQKIDQCIENINLEQILEPKCRDDDGLQKRDESKWRKHSPEEVIRLPSEPPKPCLEELRNTLCAKWANDPVVRQALYVRKGTLTSAWVRCNKTSSGFVTDVPNVIEHHQRLSKKGYRALIYSGDHDMAIPYTDTLGWIRTLNLSTDEPWRPWFVDHQVAGFTEKYRGSNGFSLTFATVKGAGHVTPVEKPKESLAMGKLTSAWVRCNDTSSAYVTDVPNVIEYHKRLSKKGYRALIYRFTKKYRGSNGFSLTFATVKGAGHVTPVDRPKESFNMLRRWFSHNPL